jgi:aromatic-L-amino-acid decarboxylase
MTNEEFRAHAHELVDWMADYLEGVAAYPVKSQVQPGEILARLPALPPEQGEPFDALMTDFKEIILPGITHWQHPSFFAYFPGNSSPPSVLAEMLTATLGAQCMSWVTSPAAAELEERVMQWLRGMIGLPDSWEGVIQDSASTATLCSLLTAREVRSGRGVNARGFDGSERYTVYCSTEAHSSIEKGVGIAGIGRGNLRTVGVDETFAMVPAALERAIVEDKSSGRTPLAVVAALGTTGSTAIDPLEAIAEITSRHGLWLHVDAAFAGTALLLPEHRSLLNGIERADTFVVNPHKWMFTNFDCSAYFVRDTGALIRTFEILPEYLKTAEREPVHNYRDWGIQLGRRFRALKLWFVIRSFGVEGLRERIRRHCAMARELALRISAEPDFEVMAPVPFNTICFRYHPSEPLAEPPSQPRAQRPPPRRAEGPGDTGRLNALNAALLERLNATGRLFLTHTKLNGRMALRLVIGQTAVEQNRRTARALPPLKGLPQEIPAPSIV